MESRKENPKEGRDPSFYRQANKKPEKIEENLPVKLFSGQIFMTQGAKLNPKQRFKKLEHQRRADAKQASQLAGLEKRLKAAEEEPAFQPPANDRLFLASPKNYCCGGILIKPKVYKAHSTQELQACNDSSLSSPESSAVPSAPTIKL